MAKSQSYKSGIACKISKQFYPSKPRMTVTQIVILALIITSSLLAILETESVIERKWHNAFNAAEMGFGIIFAIEYVLRVWVAPEQGQGRWSYIFRPLSILDLLVVVGALIPGVTGNILLIRLLRIIRLLKIGRYTKAFATLEAAIKSCSQKLAAAAVITSLFLISSATALYLVEGTIQPEQFGSIPRSLWWAVTTITTVGYGDITPITVVGRIIASLVMFGGIAVVAIPVGLIASSFVELDKKESCPICAEEMNAHISSRPTQ